MKESVLLLPQSSNMHMLLQELWQLPLTHLDSDRTSRAEYVSEPILAGECGVYYRLACAGCGG